MKILSSAKINLNLKIHDGLQDNFHKIESDIIPVGIFDEIVIKESQKDQIVFNIDKSLHARNLSTNYLLHMLIFLLRLIHYNHIHRLRSVSC